MFKNIIFKIFAVSLSLTLMLTSCTKEEKTLLGAPSATAEIGKHAMTITWSAVPNASAYTYRFNGSTAVSTTATSLTFTELTAGTDYDFALRAVCQSDSYDYSQEVTYVFSTPAETVTLSAQVEKADFDGITVSFDSSDDIDHINWYLGSEFTFADDYLAFLSGETTGVIPEQGGKFTVTTAQKLQLGEPAVIFMQAVSYDGNESDIVTLYATAAPVTFSPSYISLGSFVATVNEVKDSEYAGMGFLAAAVEEINFYVSYFQMSVSEVFLMFADYGMVEPVAPGKSYMNVLNGAPDVDHYLGLFYYGTDGSVKKLSVMDYNPGEVNPDASTATIGVKVENITESNADINFTPGVNTSGYVYRLFTQSDYESYYQKGEDYGYMDPIEYVRSLADAYGSRDYRTTTDQRTALKAGTDYILACFPYNANGTQGWGDYVLYKFSTKGAASAPAAVSAASQSVSNEKSDLLNKLLGKKLIK